MVLVGDNAEATDDWIAERIGAIGATWSEVRSTLCWREPDSNSQSLSSPTLASNLPIGRCIVPDTAIRWLMSEDETQVTLSTRANAAHSVYRFGVEPAI